MLSLTAYLSSFVLKWDSLTNLKCLLSTWTAHWDRAIRHPPLTSLSTCSAPRSPARPRLNLRCFNLYRVSGMCRLNVPNARTACLQASTKQQSGAFLEGCVESKAVHALPRGLGNQLQVWLRFPFFALSCLVHQNIWVPGFIDDAAKPRPTALFW